MSAAHRVATGWVHLYTRGLPADVAERRRDELASELFEHTCVGARPTEVLGRVLWGIPADLSWRRAARAPRLRRLETGEPMTLRNVTNGLFLLYGLFQLWATLGLLVLSDDSGATPYGLALLAGALVIGVGLWTGRTVLLCIGAVVPALTFYWMIPIFGPLALLLIGLAIASDPGRRRPAPAT